MSLKRFVAQVLVVSFTLPIVHAAESERTRHPDIYQRLDRLERIQADDLADAVEQLSQSVESLSGSVGASTEGSQSPVVEPAPDFAEGLADAIWLVGMVLAVVVAGVGVFIAVALWRLGGPGPSDPDGERNTDETDEGDRTMFKELAIRTTGIRGHTGYAIVRSGSIVEELEKALQKARANPDAYRIQLRAGNQEPVATGLDDYGTKEEAWEQLENIHDDTMRGEVARVDKS